MEIVCVLVWLFEGVSIGVLMLFHRVNYLHGSGLLKEENMDEVDKQQHFASIKLGEYIRFDTESVDEHNLSEVSTFNQSQKRVSGEI